MIHFQKGKSLESQLKILLYHAGQIICTNFKNYDWLKNFEQPIIMLQTNKAEKYTKGYWIWACLCFWNLFLFFNEKSLITLSLTL